MRKKSRAFVFCHVRNILKNIAYLDNDKSAFSLMEMMVVLLIVAILAAATAPMVTKKMARNAGTGDSPWVYTGLSNSIAYNMNGNNHSPVIIGASSLPASLESPTRLFIDSGDNASHIAFGNGATTPISITADPKNGRIGISNQQVPNNSVAFGTEQTIAGQNTITIGHEAKTLLKTNNTETNNGAIAIGYCATACADAIAIGKGAEATGNSIAIGTSNESQDPKLYATVANGEHSIAIGANADTKKAGNAIAIGYGATVGSEQDTNSVAIGFQAKTSAKNQIVLGTSDYTVYIPGNLVVGNCAFLNANDGGQTMIRRANGGDVCLIRSDDMDGVNDNLRRYDTDANNTTRSLYTSYSSSSSSDRRLKNVGEAYTAGLDELKKLDFFHYTFKKDEAKTPHVGVMAQDLQKVFPDAVTEGEDGYLRIRMEDMFYAVINAVKELDTKITQIVENVTSLSKKVDEQQQIIEAQQKMIEELQAQNANIEKRLAKVEKKSKKVAE